MCFFVIAFTLIGSVLCIVGNPPIVCWAAVLIVLIACMVYDMAKE